jgi:hypothetical protein
MRVLSSASDSGTKVLIVLLFFSFCPRNCQVSFALDDDRLPVVAFDEGRLLGYLPSFVALDEERLLGYLPGDDRLPLVEILVRCDDAMLW